MFIGVGWQDGMKNSGVMQDLKSLFWTLYIEIPLKPFDPLANLMSNK